MSRGVNEHETTNTRTKQQRTQRNHKHKEATTKRRFKHLKEPQKAPKRPQEHPKTTPRRPKKRSRTTRRQENRTKAIPRPSWISPQGPNPSLVAPLGHHLEGQIGTKTEPKTMQKRSENSRVKQKRSKNASNNKEAKKPIQDDLGPVLGRSWVVLSAILGP